MRNIKSNHTGFAAINLWLHNMHVMNKYYWRNRKNVEFPIHWRNRIYNTIRAFIFGWTPWDLRTEKQWKRTINLRHFNKGEEK